MGKNQSYEGKQCGKRPLSRLIAAIGEPKRFDVGLCSGCNGAGSFKENVEWKVQLKQRLNDIKLSCNHWPQRLFDLIARRKSCADDSANRKAIGELIRSERRSTNVLIGNGRSFIDSVLKSVYFTSDGELELISMVTNEVGYQLKDPGRANLLRELLQDFVSALLEKYDRGRRLYRSREDSFNSVVRDVRCFVGFAVEAAILYYKLPKSGFFKKNAEPLRESLRFLLTEAVFDEPTVAGTTLAIFRRRFAAEEERLRETMSEWAEKGIEEFEMTPLFYLNERTLEVMNGEEGRSPTSSPMSPAQAKFGRKKAMTKSTVSILEEDGYSSSNSGGLRAAETTAKRCHRSPLAVGPPYERAIARLREMDSVVAPSEKVKVLQDFIAEVIECIQSFFQEARYKKEYVLDSESFLSVICYCVCKSRMDFIIADLKFTTTFLSDSVMKSSVGYYLTSLEAAATFLVESSPLET